MDSGVWMGSDESSSDCLLSSEASSCEDFIGRAWAEQNQVEPKLTAGIIDTKCNDQDSQIAGPVFAARNIRNLEESQEHKDARAMINECLEKGQESVDLR